MTKIE